MFFGISESNKRTHIKNAKDNEKYFCPDCKRLLVPRRGIINAPHFAHHKGNGENKNTCVYSLKKSKSKWHSSWQDYYSEDNIEIFLRNNNEKHIADILINKTVIELQHSPISIQEFRRRNKFYTLSNLNVIWIFDLLIEYDNEQIIRDKYDNDKFYWKSPKNPFRKMNIRKEKCKIYFHISDDTKSDLIQIIDSEDNFKFFYSSKEATFSKNDFIKLTKTNIEKLLITPKIEKHEIIRKQNENAKKARARNITNEHIQKKVEISPFFSVDDLVKNNPTDQEMIILCTKFDMYFYLKIDRGVWYPNDVICIPYLYDIERNIKIKLSAPSTYHKYKDSKIWLKVDRDSYEYKNKLANNGH